MHRIRLFGPLEVGLQDKVLGRRDFGGIKPKQILEILLLGRGSQVSKDRIADYVWGESLPRNVSATLETYISVLRDCLAPDRKGGPGPIITERCAYRFDTSEAIIDLDQFDELIAQAETSEPGVARKCFEEASELARADLLSDEPYAPWATDARDQYRDRVHDALLEASQIAVNQRDFKGALGHAHRIIAADPWNESAYQIAMMSFYSLGQRQQALRAFDRCRGALEAELGVEPLHGTRSLYESIRKDDVGSEFALGGALEVAS